MSWNFDLLNLGSLGKEDRNQAGKDPARTSLDPGRWFPFSLDCCLPQQKVTVVTVDSGYSPRTLLQQEATLSAWMKSKAKNTTTDGSEQKTHSYADYVNFMKEGKARKGLHSSDDHSKFSSSPKHTHAELPKVFVLSVIMKFLSELKSTPQEEN